MADAYSSNDVLFLEMDGVLNSTAFVDESPVPKTIVVQGDTRISNNKTLFGKNTAYFDGTSDYLDITGVSLPNDFTIQGFVNVVAYANTFIFFDSREQDLTLTGFAFYLRSTGKLAFGTGNPWVATESVTTLTDNVWLHVALTRSGSTVRGFLNGALEFTVTNSSVFSNTAWKIGHGWSGTNVESAGNVAQVRITKGKALYTTAFTPPSQPFTPRILFAGDPFAADVALQLLMQGANNSVVITDTSLSKNSVSVTGNTKISNVHTLFDQNTAYFDGAGDYLSVANNQGFHVYGDYTIEFDAFIAAESGSSYTKVICGTTSMGGTSGFVLGHYQGTITIRINNTVYSGSGSLGINVRHHIALVWFGSVFKVYLNGAALYTGTAENIVTTTPLIIGNSSPIDENRYFYGSIANFRITKGVARYTANFTPPAQSFSSLSDLIIEDPFASDVVSQLSMQGDNNSTAIADSSPTPKAVTVYGDAKISNTQTLFAENAANFDGTGDYLTIPYSDDFSFGSGDFTVEAWIYPTNVSSLRAIVGPYYFSSPTTSGWLLYQGSSGQLALVLRNSSDAAVGCNSPVSALVLNTWQHVAFTKSSNTYRLFKDGINVAELTDSIAVYVHPSAKLIVGRWDNDATTSRDFLGSISNLRITKGVARYTANFTPPKAFLRAFELSGNVTILGGGTGIEVAIRDWTTRELVTIVIPEVNGNWKATLPSGQYEVAYFAPSCQPICEGPYILSS